MPCPLTYSVECYLQMLLNSPVMFRGSHAHTGVLSVVHVMTGWLLHQFLHEGLSTGKYGNQGKRTRKP